MFCDSRLSESKAPSLPVVVVVVVVVTDSHIQRIILATEKNNGMGDAAYRRCGNGVASPRGVIRTMGVIAVACQEFGLTVSEKKIEAMHLWSDSSTTSNALRIETPGQRYKPTNELVYLGGAISESADLDIENKHRTGAAWANIRKYKSHFYDLWNARLSLTIRPSVTWVMLSQDLSSMRTTHHKLLLRVIGFRRKDRTGHKLLSYRKAVERTGS